MKKIPCLRIPGYKVSIIPTNWYSKLLFRIIKFRFVVRADDSMKVRGGK